MNPLSPLYLNSPHKKRRVPRRGMTLIETLISTVIFAILAVSLFVVFKAGLDSWRRAQAHLDVYQEARMALDMITRDLVPAYLNPADATIRFRGYDTSSRSGWMTNSADDELFFIAALSPTLNDSSAVTELCKVGYFRDTTNNLYRVYTYFNALPNFNFSAADYATRHKIASNVTQLHLRYWDPTLADFVNTNTWDSGAGTQLGRLPSMVEVTISVKERNSARIQTFTTNVYIPWR